MGADGNFDVIIVGAGSAGCIMAARLTEDPDLNVLLLEGGPDFKGVDDCPDEILDEMGYPFDFMWGHEGVPTERDDHVVPAFRGKVLGGSGSVNGMLYTRGDPRDYDSWGSPLWTNESLAPAFARIERDLDHPERSRGQVPLKRVPSDEMQASQAAFQKAAIELGHADTADLLPNTQDGVGPIPRNSENGVRMSNAHCYLNPVRDRPNLTVRGGCLVGGIAIEDGRAVGVQVMKGRQVERIDGGEVILAAGGFGSPQLLMLSGIGSKPALEKLGIPLVAEVPGVGKNLTDHGLVQVIATLEDGTEPGDPRNLVGLRYTSEGYDREGDMYLLTASGDFSGQVGRNYSVSGEGGENAEIAEGKKVFVCIFCVMNLPDSTGEVEVISKDPRILPQIRYNYLGTDGEVDRFAAAARHAVELLETEAFKPIVHEIVSPSPETLASESAMGEWVATSIATALHSAGTCKMGAADDPEAVVDDHGRVKGVEGLRVADFSVAPVVPRSPTNATAMAIGERMAELFIADRADARSAVANS